MSPSANGSISPTSPCPHSSLGFRPSGVGLGSCISDKFPGDSVVLRTQGPREDHSSGDVFLIPPFP